MIATWLALAGAPALGEPAPAPAGEEIPDAAARTEPDYDLSGALALVDWLGWAASDRDIDRYVATARSAEGPFAPSLSPAGRAGLATVPMPALYAVEATVADVRIAERQHVLVQIREAIVYDNPAAVPLEGLALRVFANGQDYRSHGVDIQGVWVDNRPARFTIDGTILSVELDEPLPPGHRARILLHLIEEVPPFDPRGPVEGGIDPETTGAFGRADGWVNLGYWLPLVTPTDRRGRFDIRPLRANTEHAMFDPALFHVVLNTPAELSLATTGVTVHRSIGGTEATTIAVAGLSRDFAAILAPSASASEEVIEGITVRLLRPASDPAMGKHLTEYAARILQNYTERFGPLSIAELDIVEAPIRGMVGLDHPGLVSIDVSHQRVPYHRSAAHEWALAHELAHQWWASEVGSDPAASPWLDEALASHSASLYWLDQYGEDALEARITLDVVDRTRRLRDEGRPDLPANLAAWEYDLDQYAAIVYGRGAIFFDRVRETLGEQAHDSALRQYHERFTGRFATPVDLLGVLSAATAEPEQINTLYAHWIEQAHGYEDLLR